MGARPVALFAALELGFLANPSMQCCELLPLHMLVRKRKKPETEERHSEGGMHWSLILNSPV